MTVLKTQKPDRAAEVIHALCRIIETKAEEPLRLAELAKKAGYSPFHLQRLFKQVTGSTPAQYHRAARLRRLKEKLKEAPAATDAVYDAGYGSLSRVYEKVNDTLGMTPDAYRRGGEGLSIHYADADTLLGRMRIGATERGICFLQFGQNAGALEKQLRQEYPKAVFNPMPEAMRKEFNLWMAALHRYLSGQTRALLLPLDLRGTAFELMVWRYLQTILTGETQSYTQVAKALGRPTSARAVAHACAANTVAIAIPCHRVLRGDGNLAGYRWGLKRKRALLALESKFRQV